MVYPETFQALGLTKWEDYPKPRRFEYKPMDFRPYDVDIEIECCGVCGSDIHAAASNWGHPYLPIAVGHEIIGKAIKVGPEATAKYGIQVGDRVGVGAQCDCDDSCYSCQVKLENLCHNNKGTYFGKYDNGHTTIGGNASHVRTNGKFVFKIPDTLSSEHAAPLLCGGVTGFSPLLQAGVTKGTKVGVVGFGGIGSMTLQFAVALGAEVTVISRGHAKEEDARKMGGSNFIDSTNEDEIKANGDSLDLIVNTTSSFSDSALSNYLTVLRPRGKLFFITFPPNGEMVVLPPAQLLFRGISVQGSALGTPEEIKYMLEFAAEKGIKPWVETVDINEKNLGECWEKTEASKAHYRFVMTGYNKFFNQESSSDSSKI